MSFRVMVKKTIAIFCLALAALFFPEWAGRNAECADKVGAIQAPAKEPPWTVYALHTKLVGYEKILKGFQSALPEANLVEIDLTQPHKVSSSKEKYLVLAVGDYALGYVRNINAARIAKKSKPISVVYVCVEMPPQADPFITGVSKEIDVETQFHIISKAFPGKSVGTIYNPFLAEETIKAAQEAAKKLNIVLNAEPLKFGAPDEAVFSRFAFVTEFSGVYWELCDPFLMERTDLIYKCYRYARKIRKPVVTFHEELVGAGKMQTKGLMAINNDFVGIGNQGAAMGRKIFNGASPKDIPPEKPASGLITVNLTEAEYFGVTITPEVAPKGWRFECVRPKK